MAGTPPPAGTPPATTDPVKLAETAHDEYLDALTANKVAKGVYALTPTAANLTALREAVDKVVTEASEALVLAGDGTAAQLVRAQNAVDATVTDSNDVLAIEEAVMAAADLVTALANAATAATTYDSAKVAYEATGGMTQANLDALSYAAKAAKATADAALALAQGGSAAQLSEAQAAVAAADMAATHASGITMALEAGIADALTAYDTAKTAHTAAKTAHDGDASVDNANDLKTAADKLLAAAMDAQDKGALGATADQQTELESVSVTDAGTYVAAADTAVTTAQTAADAAAVVVATKEAGTKMEAITEEAGEMGVAADAGLGGSVEADAMTTYSMTIERPRSGTVVEITDTANAADDDPEFTLYKDLGKGRTMHTRKMEADEDGNVVEEVVIVSTDIEPPKAVAFAKFLDDEGMLTQVLDASSDATNDDDEVTFEALIVSAANANLVKSPAFTAGGAGTIDFPGNIVDADDEDDATRKAGTYNGAEGEYRCTAACTVVLDDKGVVTALTNWIFTPDAGATSDQRDYDYLHYGFWLEKTTDEDGVLTYNEVETFAGSSFSDEGSNVDGVEGSATYNGGATGVYVKEVQNSDGTLDTATAGHFTADAELTAYFGGGDVAANKHDSITGTIDKFALSGEEENGWSVALKSDIFTATAGTASGTANGGGAVGSFNATFYGDTTAMYDHDDDALTPEIPRQPSSVVGEFDANFSNGSVAGGFGARK